MSPSASDVRDAPLEAQAQRGNRESGDDFYCRRYEIWYESFDCALRSYYRTCRGCMNCEQGRFNLHRHRLAVQRVRSAPPSAWD